MSSRVVVALRVKAAPARAFEAFVRDIAIWWRPNPIFQTTPRAPGVLAFEPCLGGRLTETLDSGKIFQIGEITVWDPPNRLVFSWRQATFPPGLSTEVEVTFEAAGGGARICVEHRGFDLVPLDSAARHGFPDQALLMRLAEWWRALLTSLGQAA